MDSQVLRTLSSKLGITNSNIIRKAEELVRLLTVNCGSGLSLSTSSRTVICLDVAASSAGSPVDKNAAIKLSGLNRSQYMSSSQTVNRVLKISPNVLIGDLCITHGVADAKELAYQILKEYEKGLPNPDGVDLSLPVFQTAAVAAACSSKKIKIDKRKLCESSCSKRAVYTKLVESMTEIGGHLLSKKLSDKKGNKRTKTLMDIVEDNMQDSPASKKGKSDDIDSGSEEQDDDGDFEAWKKKILEAAAVTQ